VQVPLQHGAPPQIFGISRQDPDLQLAHGRRLRLIQKLYPGGGRGASGRAAPPARSPTSPRLECAQIIWWERSTPGGSTTEVFGHIATQLVADRVDIPAGLVQQPLHPIGRALTSLLGRCQPLLRSTWLSRPRRSASARRRGLGRPNRSATQACRASSSPTHLTCPASVCGTCPPGLLKSAKGEHTTRTELRLQG
jgi:hypothetical protein